ncbi:Modulator of FtsH protease HflC [Buchnera aphidicola (Eriosoma lanigerum)]
MNKVIFAFFSTLCIFLSSSFFIVHEGQRAIILHLGKIVVNHRKHTQLFLPGLHVKIPYIESVRLFDSRIQTIDNHGKWFITKDKKKIYINIYIQWKIKNFKNFYLSTINQKKSIIKLLIINQLNNLLQNQISSLNFNKIGIHTFSLYKLKTQLLVKPISEKIINFINTDKTDTHDIHLINKIQYQNSNIYKSIHKNSNLESLGIKILDIKIQNFSFPISNFSTVFCYVHDMCNTIANSYRSSAIEESEKIRSLSHIQATKILSSMKKKLMIFKLKNDL